MVRRDSHKESEVDSESETSEIPTKAPALVKTQIQGFFYPVLSSRPSSALLDEHGKAVKHQTGRP
jgi:hypothetical protein